MAAVCVHAIWTARAASISSLGAAASIIARAALMCEEAATSPAILVPGDSPPLFDTSGDEPPDVINWSSLLRCYLIASSMK
jgi:hypothetical protein